MPVKINFDPHLTYQDDAIQSVVRLFDGQQPCKSTFSIPQISFDKRNVATPRFDFSTNIDAVGNILKIDEDRLLDNLRTIQISNGLPQTTAFISQEDYNFTVEMETGTGKTYVYLKTIFELNKNYGFTKFIIVVPSIAIKEGVKKSLDDIKEHFMQCFDNPKYDYFIYDSKEKFQTHDFASADSIQIMVINIDAFRKSFDDPDKKSKSNVIHRSNDQLPDDTAPIEFIKATNPIVIIDEPQTVDSTEKSSKAITSLNPLCTIRYSATHKQKHHPIYKLDAFDAYEQKLVKQIEVAGMKVANNFNNPYIRLIDVSDTPRNAKLELDVLEKGIVKRKTLKMKIGDDLGQKTKRDLYQNYQIDDIYVDGADSYINFTNNDIIIKKGQAIGDTATDDLKRSQIRRTIEEHLDKELKLLPMGIKVLSLFFIDRVANYREYDEEGTALKGKFAIMFEEEFKKAISRNPKYQKLVDMTDLDYITEQAHDGYFSIDKKNKFVEGEETNDTNKANAERGYNLIMKNKDILLSKECPVRFIFSHSALREGWDNPNVFQICALREVGDEIDRRQRVGRGLRICVNQNGDRVYGTEINVLTVVASENFEDFCDKLQKEFEKEAGLTFGTIQKHTFANIVITTEDGAPAYLGQEKSDKIYTMLNENGYIDKKGKIQDSLRTDLKHGNFTLPEELNSVANDITTLLKKISGGLNVKDADKKPQTIKVNTAVIESAEFKELWNKIKYKTTYNVDFDDQNLITMCVNKIKEMPKIEHIKIFYYKGKAHITNAGIGKDSELKSKHYTVERDYEQVPDILTYLQNETSLKRQTIVDILIQSGRLNDFRINPQLFIETICAIIQEQKQNCIIDGIKYEKINDTYEQNLFIEEELKSRLLKVDRSPMDSVVCDSDIEENFAKQLDRSANVKLFAKLPKERFKINTPLGSYSPDWAVVLEEDNLETLYFVVETKGTKKEKDLSGTENIKIACGKKHFEALDTGIKFSQEKTFDDFIASAIENKL